jgi:multidrug resistance protein, MATE family
MSTESSSETLTPASSSPPTESTALIPKLVPDINDESPFTYRQWLSEILLLSRASIPVILAYTLQNSLQTVSVLIVGRLSPEALATAAFSYMFAMATAWLIALGGTTALDTLASSSYTGSTNRHDLGILLQRGIAVLSVFYALVAVLWWFSEHVFRALGQEDFICVQSSMFLRCLIPGGLGYVWFESMKKFLQAQGELRRGNDTSYFAFWPEVVKGKHYTDKT